LEVASAYTTFSNGGVWMRQNGIREVRDQNGKIIWQYKPVSREILDPRVAYMVTNMMQEVLRSGTGASTRSRGFQLPAAGKTGTSHDAWFAGFTSRLLCVVWVGFDDNSELPLQGAQAALPIWTEFMKRAHSYHEYKNVSDFPAPDGIVTAEIDPLNGMLATPNCPKSRGEVFIAGTQPLEYCTLHGGSGKTTIAGWDTPDAESSGEHVEGATGAVPAAVRPARRADAPQEARKTAPAPPAKPQPKQGFWDKIKSIFK
jgi:penicillin-binding protein 1B